MSKSKNMWSKYHSRPAYVLDRVPERPRTRDERAMGKAQLRVTITGILENTTEEEDWKWWL